MKTKNAEVRELADGTIEVVSQRGISLTETLGLIAIHYLEKAEVAHRVKRLADEARDWPSYGKAAARLDTAIELCDEYRELMHECGVKVHRR